LKGFAARHGAAVFPGFTLIAVAGLAFNLAQFALA
jgi:hypothetical protein